MRLKLNYLDFDESLLTRIEAEFFVGTNRQVKPVACKCPSSSICARMEVLSTMDDPSSCMFYSTDGPSIEAIVAMHLVETRRRLRFKQAEISRFTKLTRSLNCLADCSGTSLS